MTHDPRRTADLKAIHAMKRELALDDVTYQALLLRTGGKRSSADMNALERGRVLDELRRLGAGRKPKRPGHRPHADSALARKALGLWISLYELGGVDDNTDRGLAAFAKRQCGIDDLRWLKPAEGFKLIEALKSRCAREGYDADAAKAEAIGRAVTPECFAAPGGFATPVPPDLDQPLIRGLQTLLIRAQWQKLEQLGAFTYGAHARLSTFLKGTEPQFLSIDAQRTAIKRLGNWIRQVKAAQARPAEAAQA